MNISKNIPLNIEKVIEEIQIRQGEAWNNGRINERNNFPYLMKLFKIMNSGVPCMDFFYCGNIFRLHSAYVSVASVVDLSKEEIVSKICSDGSCVILPRTTYSNSLVAFSKSPDFTNKEIYYKVNVKQTSILIHSNTKTMYGIDVNKFLHHYNIETRFEGEQEVLFPLLEKCIIKEYKGTPNKFRYYLRSYI